MLLANALGPMALALAVTLLAACATKGGDAHPSGSAAAVAATTARAPAAAAKSALSGVTTRGTVELPDDKRKVAYSIELPEGLKDVSERDFAKTYAARAKSYDGYTVRITQASSHFAQQTLDAVVAQMSTDPDAVKNKARLLDKGTTPDGYWLAHSIQEGKKKAVIAIAIKRKGNISLQCRGEVEGALAEKPEAAAAVLAASCRTLTIQS